MRQKYNIPIGTSVPKDPSAEDDSAATEIVDGAASINDGEDIKPSVPTTAPKSRVTKKTATPRAKKTPNAGRGKKTVINAAPEADASATEANDPNSLALIPAAAFNVAKELTQTLDADAIATTTDTEDVKMEGTELAKNADDDASKNGVGPWVDVQSNDGRNDIVTNRTPGATPELDGNVDDDKA
jgi:hypothetical protein